MSTAPTTIEVPVLALPQVLFPGGRQRLRMGGALHLDLIRECAHGDGSFGVSLMLEGQGDQHVPANVGTRACVSDFHSLEDGALVIEVHGMQRFTAEPARVRDSGLVISRMQLWPDPPAMPVPAQHMLLVTILERLAEHDAELGAAPRANFDDAGWVAFRLADSLPLEEAERQYLLQMPDPLQQLDQLLHYLPRFAAD